CDGGSITATGFSLIADDTIAIDQMQPTSNALRLGVTRTRREGTLIDPRFVGVSPAGAYEHHEPILLLQLHGSPSLGRSLGRTSYTENSKDNVFDRNGEEDTSRRNVLQLQILFSDRNQ